MLQGCLRYTEITHHYEVNLEQTNTKLNYNEFVKNAVIVTPNAKSPGIINRVIKYFKSH